MSATKRRRRQLAVAMAAFGSYLDDQRGRSRRNAAQRRTRRWTSMADERSVPQCGYCNVPVREGAPATQLMAPVESLRVVLATIATIDDGNRPIAIRMRRALRRRRARSPGSLCRYCFTRLAVGRDAAEALAGQEDG